MLRLNKYFPQCISDKVHNWIEAIDTANCGFYVCYIWRPEKSSKISTQNEIVHHTHTHTHVCTHIITPECFSALSQLLSNYNVYALHMYKSVHMGILYLHIYISSRINLNKQWYFYISYIVRKFCVKIQFEFVLRNFLDKF